MPFKPYETLLVLKKQPGGSVLKLFIHRTKTAVPNIEPSAYVKNRWSYSELKTGGNAMVSSPRSRLGYCPLPSSIRRYRSNYIPYNGAQNAT
jgi:hypothetical protein